MPCPKYHLTKHAILRYQERFDQCSRRDAAERLMHAAMISRAPTKKQREWMSRKRVSSYGQPAVWCEVIGMMLLCGRLPDGTLIVKTVMPVPDDDKCRQDMRKRRQKHKEGRRYAQKLER